MIFFKNKKQEYQSEQICTDCNKNFYCKYKQQVDLLCFRTTSDYNNEKLEKKIIDVKIECRLFEEREV